MNTLDDLRRTFDEQAGRALDGQDLIGAAYAGASRIRRRRRIAGSVAAAILAAVAAAVPLAVTALPARSPSAWHPARSTAGRPARAARCSS